MTALPPHIRAFALTFVLSSSVLHMEKHPYNVGNHVRCLLATLISPFT